MQAVALTVNVALPKFDPVTPAEIWVGVGGDIGELCLSKKPAKFTEAEPRIVSVTSTISPSENQ